MSIRIISLWLIAVKCEKLIQPFVIVIIIPIVLNLSQHANLVVNEERKETSMCMANWLLRVDEKRNTTSQYYTNGLVVW